jgi:hypothetical protein
MKLPKVFLPRPLLPMSTVAITANNAHNKGRPKEEFENLPGQLCDVKDMECNRRDALDQVRDPPRASLISEKHIALSVDQHYYWRSYLDSDGLWTCLSFRHVVKSRKTRKHVASHSSKPVDGLLPGEMHL